MIYRLRAKFIRISAVSLFAVLLIIFAVLVILNAQQVNASVDILADTISDNNGVFPDFGGKAPPPDRMGGSPDFITKESRFSTRFFSVRLDTKGNVIGSNMASISSVTVEETSDYAQKALERGKERGWIDNFRYRVTSDSLGKSVVFVDGSMNRNMSRSFILTSAVVLLCSGIVVMLLIIVLSKKAVKPVAESYEKQNQFITDANHELKTPLTLILANLDIAESELGQNEWLDDIRVEGQRMSVLINKLVSLTRMDESTDKANVEEFDMSCTVSDTVSEFRSAAENRGLMLTCLADDGVKYTGDESSIRRLISILLENAVKYCDEGGDISVTLTSRRHPVLCVENSYAEVDATELSKLFDRFYRSDRARTFDGGYGIGLSIAKMIAEKHRSELSAYKAGVGRIGFMLALK